jgi:prepilin-type N-terminal cleavage/methylation domain-containing protein/prepilin-type processing-associated H-X9-DG protein
MTRRRSGFTLVELLIVIAIVGALLALILPAVQSARAAARSADCKSNMRQIGLAVLQYCERNGGQFPEWYHSGAERSWIYTLAADLERVDEVRICAEDPRSLDRLRARASSYVLNDYLAAPDVPHAIRSLNKLRATSRTIVAFEGANKRAADPKYDHAHASQWFSEFNLAWGTVAAALKNDIELGRHFGTANYLYVDGHVDVISAANIAQWIDLGRDFARPE